MLTVSWLTTLAMLITPLAAIAKDIPSVFYISKSENRNQVNYGIHLNQNCSPVNAQPVYAYWQMGNGKTENLLKMEQRGYGIASQAVSSNEVNLVLNGMRNIGIQQAVVVTISGTNGNCQAKAYTTINGSRHELSHAHLTITDVKRNPFTGGTLGGKIVKMTLISTDGTQEAIPCSTNCKFGL